MDMRLVLTIMMAITLLPQIQAIGIASFLDYSAGFEMDQGDEIDLEFVLRGDDVEHDNVVFFIESQDNALEFNGDYRYEREYNLDQYEDVDINIEMKAIRDGEFEVHYGFIEEPTGGGFGVQSVVDNFFDVEIGYVEEEDNDFDIIVDAEQENSGPRGRSSGGGGAYIPPEEAEKTYINGLWQDPDTGIYYDADGSEYDQEFASAILAGDVALDGTPLTSKGRRLGEVIAQDVSAQGSATNEVVAETGQGNTPAPALTVASVAEGGKEFMVLVLVLGFLAVITTFGAATYVNREGSE